MTTCIDRRLCGRMDAGGGDLEYSIAYPQTGVSPNIDRFYGSAAAGYLERIKKEYLPALRRMPPDCRGECRSISIHMRIWGRSAAASAGHRPHGRSAGAGQSGWGIYFSTRGR